MILEFEINGIKYDYRKDALVPDGVYQLDTTIPGYVLTENIPPQVQTEVDRLLAVESSTQYMRDREAAYPSIQDQLDSIYHSGVAGWKLNIKAVKDAHPKP
jgi:hypothetical protein